MYGLTAPYGPAAGQLMLKSWKVATDMQPLLEELNLRCNHTEPHTAISGKNTSASENYPPDMARAVHRAFAKHAATDMAMITAGKWRRRGTRGSVRVPLGQPPSLRVVREGQALYPPRLQYAFKQPIPRNSKHCFHRWYSHRFHR